ncbi:MAG: glutathione S-transferase C-terminal domain-containing protein [Neisseria sp.]|nr:glutathione S-transferase C-terminal domain-containing protein [Neisseria sp.]
MNTITLSQIKLSQSTQNALSGTPKPLFQLYLAAACPFCHRVSLAIALTGLQAWFDIRYTEDIKPDSGWQILPENEPLWQADTVKALYHLASDGTKQGSSVPLLIEIGNKRLLSDSSADMVRWISTGFHGAVAVKHDLLAGKTHAELDDINQTLHNRLNRAVYRLLSSENQADYEQQLNDLFVYLDEWECRLNGQYYALGEQPSEADVFLLPSLLRFDAIYHRLFYCSKKRIADYPNLERYRRQLLKQPEIAQTFDLQRSMNHYYLSALHLNGKAVRLNPLGIVPVLG